MKTMINKEELLKAIRSKKANLMCANKLGISLEEYISLKKEIANTEEETYQELSSASILLEKHNLGDNFNVSSGWLKEDGISVQFKRKTEEIDYKDQFIEFLKTFSPKESVIESHEYDNSKKDACLVLNIQDAHYNKYDIYGENNIYTRFSQVREKIKRTLTKSTCLNNLSKTLYIIGSDIFNSEWTGMTTKGTPQQNIMSYQESFKAICQNEIDIIEMLLHSSREIDVIYCPGNHDEFVGWHLIHWLQSYFRNQKNISFDTSDSYTKFKQFSDTAICINHGDAQKPEIVARNFPILYKEKWSSCNHFIIFSGDLHTELSRDFNGIKFYRIPCLSTAKSKWDEKNGYTTSKPELTAFLIEENEGMTTMIKQALI